MVGRLRGVTPLTARAIASMCSGVLPQQPPARLMKPDSEKSLSLSCMSSGKKGKPVGESGSGMPAFG